MHALSFEFLVAGPMQVVLDTRVLSSIWNFQEHVYFTAHFGSSWPISANQNCWWCRAPGPFCPMCFPMAVTTNSIFLTYLVNHWAEVCSYWKRSTLVGVCCSTFSPVLVWMPVHTHDRSWTAVNNSVSQNCMELRQWFLPAECSDVHLLSLLTATRYRSSLHSSMAIWMLFSCISLAMCYI